MSTVNLDPKQWAQLRGENVPEPEKKLPAWEEESFANIG